MTKREIKELKSEEIISIRKENINIANKPPTMEYYKVIKNLNVATKDNFFDVKKIPHATLEITDVSPNLLPKAHIL